MKKILNKEQLLRLKKKDLIKAVLHYYNTKNDVLLARNKFGDNLADIIAPDDGDKRVFWSAKEGLNNGMWLRSAKALLNFKKSEIVDEFVNSIYVYWL